MLAQANLIDERYALVRSLGAGGFAEVWLADDLRQHRQVALKLPRGQRSALASAATSPASREFALAARLEHPHIVRVLGTGESEGEPYLVLEYVDGPSLRERLRDGRPLSIPEVQRLAGELTSALAHAHSRGILHNDIKPENILLGPNGAKLTDFGAAAGMLTTVTAAAPGDFAATIAYLAPEVLQGEQATPASDIYALGLVLYEAAAGRLPWNGSTAAALAGQRMAAPAPSLETFVPEAPATLSEALSRALWAEPAGRFQHAEEFGLALRGAEPTVVIRRPAPTITKPATSAAAVAAPVAPRPVQKARKSPAKGATVAGVPPVRRTPRWLPAAGLLGGGLAGAVGLAGLLGAGDGQFDAFREDQKPTATPKVELVVSEPTPTATATSVPPTATPPPATPTKRPPVIITIPGLGGDNDRDKPGNDKKNEKKDDDKDDD
jgi:serine/threonine-protein kinase